MVAGSVALDVARVGAPNPPPVLGRAIPAALWTVASAILAGWLILAAVHLRDDYRMSHVQGIWVAAAEAARGGALYPPLFDGEHYSGTRYMPLAILLNAFGSATTGDAILGGKMIAATLMAVLLATIILVLKRCSCPLSLAFALAAAVVATDTGLQAGTTIGGDLLPVVLQAGALALAARGRNSRQFILAGVLAGLAFASKLTGLWGAFAIITWLAINQQWRRAAVFALATVATVAVTLGVVQLFTNGGLSEHLLAFAFAGVRGGGTIFRGPNQLLFNLLGHATATVVLFPLAIIGALMAGGWRQLSVFHIALMYALLVLMVVYADFGTGFNQLLDLVVLVVLVVGEWVGRVTTKVDFATPPVLALVIAVTVVWADGLDLVRTVGFDVRGAVASVRNGSPTCRTGRQPTGGTRRRSAGRRPVDLPATAPPTRGHGSVHAAAARPTAPGMGRSVDPSYRRAAVRARRSRRVARGPHARLLVERLSVRPACRGCAERIVST